MNKALGTIFFFITFLLSNAPAVIAGNFIAMTAPYPPYSVSCGLNVTGVSVTTLQTIMETCGTPLRSSAIKLTPWAVAYEDTARRNKRIMLNAERNRKTERLYKWVGPVTTTRMVLVSKKNRNMLITDKSQLKNYQIATIRWSRPEKALIANGVAPEQLKRSPTHVKPLRQLDCGEVDLFAVTESDIARLANSLSMKAEDFKIQLTIDEEPLYFAFSKDTDDTLIAQLNKALKDLKATGHGGYSEFDRMFANEIMQ